MRYKLTIEYDGTNYCGWQKQQGKFSVEETIEKAVELITGEVVEVYGCGRTDAGVHAISYVAHFDLVKNIEPYRMMSALNFYLRSQYLSRTDYIYVGKNDHMQDISILNCEIVDDEFHARFSAKKRLYRYRILNRRQPTAIDSKRVWQVYKELDFDKMQEALQFLTGKRDWSSFRDSDCQAKSPVKTIDKVALRRDGDEIVFEIEAKSFLHHMVRNIVGTLVEIGLGKMSLEQFVAVIGAKDRKKAGPTAPPQGLYFLKVLY